MHKIETITMKLANCSRFKICADMFRHADGTPMLFYSDFSSDDLEKIIVNGGGAFDNERNSDYKLTLNPTQEQRQQGFLSVDWIIKCVNKNVFIDANTYKRKFVTPSFDYNRPMCSKDDDDFFPLDTDDNFPATKRRRKYSYEEDVAILTYVSQHNRFAQIKGNALWKAMMYKKVTSHTDQSMKSRFKVILNSLDKYDIPDQLRRKLRGEKPDTLSRQTRGGCNNLNSNSRDVRFLFSESNEEESCCSKGGKTLLSSHDLEFYSPSTSPSSVASVDRTVETAADVNVRLKTNKNAEGQKISHLKKSSTQTLSDCASRKTTFMTETEISQHERSKQKDMSAESIAERSSNNKSTRRTRGNSDTTTGMDVESVASTDHMVEICEESQAEKLSLSSPSSGQSEEILQPGQEKNSPLCLPSSDEEEVHEEEEDIRLFNFLPRLARFCDDPKECLVNNSTEAEADSCDKLELYVGYLMSKFDLSMAEAVWTLHHHSGNFESARQWMSRETV